MAGRTRLFRRSSWYKSSDSVGSNILNPDTNIINDEQTSWWNNLEDNTFMPRPSIYNEKNETTKHLNPNSQLDSDHPIVEKWWTNLESSNSEHNTSTTNFSAAIIKDNILEKSTSESEKETNVKKRKIPLRARSRKSNSNAFLKALNDTDITSSSRTLRKTRERASKSNTPVKNTSQGKLHEIKDDSTDISSLATVSKSRANVFNRKRKARIDSDNIFENILKEDDILNTEKELMVSEDNSAITQNTSKNKSLINQTKTRSLPLKDNKKQSSKLSTLTSQNLVSEDNIVAKIIPDTDESDETSIILKSKPSVLTRSRKSMEQNAFQDALEDNRHINLSRHVLNQEIDIGERKLRSSMKSSSPLKEFNKSQNKIDATAQTAKQFIDRSQRSITKKHLSNTPIQDIQDNVEQDMTDLSSDETVSRLSFEDLKTKSRLLKRIEKSPINNPFEEILKNNEITDDYSDSISLKISSINEENTTEKLNVQTENKIASKISKTDNMDISKLNSRKSTTIKTPQTRISSNVEPKDKVSEISRKNINITSPIDTAINRAKPYIITSHNDLHDNTDGKQARSTPIKQLSNLNPSKEIHGLSINSRNQSGTSKTADKSTTESIRQSLERNIENEEDSDITEDAEIEINNKSPKRSSKKMSNNKDINTIIDKNTKPLTERFESRELEITDNTDISSVIEKDKRNSFLLRSKTNNKIYLQNSSKSFITQTSNRASIEQNRETLGRQQNKSQSYHRTPIKALNNDIPSNINKINSSKSTKITDFCTVISTDINKKQTSSTDRPFLSTVFTNTKKIEKINKELEKIKNRETVAMKMNLGTNKKKSLLNAKEMELNNLLTKKKLLVEPKVIDKAFLVNGKVYKAPRLPRPKHWVTDHLYKFLWKHMESKYKFATRVQSEKFILELAKMVSFIERRKEYKNYKRELEALMMEMARLGIIRTRNDFYNFCQDFLPYSFRVKVIPILLPGNKTNIPYNPDKLHIPLLNTGARL